MVTKGQWEGAERVLVYGVTGSGKTTLAARVAEARGLPWHSVDDLTWEPGWVAVSDDVQRARIGAICEGQQWVLDTAYAKWIDLPLPRVQLIVGLDYPRWVSFGRLVRRTVARFLDGTTVCNGNRETLSNIFSRDSILVWHFRSFRRKRARIRGWLAAESGPAMVVFERPAEVEAWLSDWSARPRRSISE